MAINQNEWKSTQKDLNNVMLDLQELKKYLQVINVPTDKVDDILKKMKEIVFNY